MWIFLPNSMVSIIEKPADREVSTLTVRGWVVGDIESVFPDAKVTEGGGTDYKYRATLPREQVAQALAQQVMDLDWPNFKGAVHDQQWHDAYSRVWQAMFYYQERAGR